MRTGDTITLRQLIAAMRRDLAWVRIYTDPQGWNQRNCMSQEAIEEAVHELGDRTVQRVAPGYGHAIVYLDRE